MTRRILLPIVVLAALTGPAGAAQLTLTDTWQNLGTGPLLISVLNGDGMFEASATAPTDSGLPIFRNQQPFAFNATTSIWAKRRSTSANPVVTYTPITVGGAGGGGGPVTQNTTPWQISCTANANTSSNPCFVQLTAGTANIGSVANTGFNALQGGAANTASNPFFTQLTAGTATIGAVTQASGPWAVSWTGQTVAATQGAPATVANAWPTYLAQGGAALSTTNPIFEQTVGPSMQAPGTSGTIARSVQGVTNGVPIPVTGTVGSIGFATATSAAPSYTNNQTAPVSQTLAGGLRVDGSAVTQPVNITSLVGTALGAPTGMGTPGSGNIQSTNSAIMGQYISSLPSASNFGFGTLMMDKRQQIMSSETGSDDARVGITPAVAQSATSLVGKAAQGNLYSAYAVNTTTTAGYLVCINATAAPATGTALTGANAPVDVATMAAQVGATATINYAAGPPNAYSTGITCLVSTSLTTYTAGGASFIQARVR